MFGIKSTGKRHTKDEAEKPFWISFSDMMTALMVLFLVAMTVTLLAVTHEISEAEKDKSQRDKEINELMIRIRDAAKDIPGVIVRGNTIDFGDRARFDTNSHALTEQQERLLRAFIPDILMIARDPIGKKWLKRVIVEGFADQRGTYLHNLHLSMQRSERVLCALLAKSAPDEKPLSEDDRLLIRELFLVGGSSFNSLKETLEESRRIEFKLEFLELNEERPRIIQIPLDDCQNCPLDR